MSVSRRVPERGCPRCGRTLDAVGVLGAAEAPEPVPGDVTICAYCCAWLAFGEALSLRLLSKAERDALPDDTRRELERASAAIERFNAAKERT